MSKAEKRWNRIGNDLNWEKGPDGSHEVPPQAVPIVVLMAIFMLVLMVVAPNGAANTSGVACALAALVFLGIAVLGMLLVLVGHNFPEADQKKYPKTPTSFKPSLLHPPTSMKVPPQPPIILPILKRFCATIIFLLSFKWMSKLPDWLQPILWGLGLSLPFVLLIWLMMSRQR